MIDLKLLSKWVITFNSLSLIVDSKVHVINISHVIITYASESLSSLTQITCNLQATINLRKRGNKKQKHNKANLRDLIAATGLEILLKLDWNGRFFARVTLKFDGWPWKTIRQVFYTTSSFVYHFRSINEFKLELQSENAQSGSNSMLFLAVWPWNLTYGLEKQ